MGGALVVACRRRLESTVILTLLWEGRCVQAVLLLDVWCVDSLRPDEADWCARTGTWGMGYAATCGASQLLD